MSSQAGSTKSSAARRMQLNPLRNKTEQVATSLKSMVMSSPLLRTKMLRRRKERVRSALPRGGSKRPRSRSGRGSTRRDRHCSRKRGRRGEKSGSARTRRDARNSRQRWPS
jgi:hypothetical protein